MAYELVRDMVLYQTMKFIELLSINIITENYPKFFQ